MNKSLIFNNKRIETELCAYSVEAVRTAAQSGVTRVELCVSPSEGGTMPPAHMIAEARRLANAPGHSNLTAGEIGSANQPNHNAAPLELSVIIRPRGGDFVYSDREFETMKRQIEIARKHGADGVVFGILTLDGNVDVARTQQLVELARPMESTFHRAFDEVKNWPHALEDINRTGCVRILTSGLRSTAHEGRETIQLVVKAAAGRIEIMAGGGVNPENASLLADTGVDALHFSAKTVGDPSFVREMVAIVRERNTH